MPSKKKKYNARFPAGRIKKIMQTDEEVGKVAQAVPIIISRTLELFVESLLTKSMMITHSRSAKTLTPSHMKQCILSESRFDFLKDLVKDIPDASVQEDNENNANEMLNYSKEFDETSSAVDNLSEPPKPEIAANFYTEQSPSASRTPVIQYGPKVAQTETSKLSFSVENLVKPASEPKAEVEPSQISNLSSPATQLPVPELVRSKSKSAGSPPNNNNPKEPKIDNIPALIPISHNFYGQNTSDNLYIDEDYDN